MQGLFPRPAGLGCTQLALGETRGKSNGETERAGDLRQTSGEGVQPEQPRLPWGPPSSGSREHSAQPTALRGTTDPSSQPTTVLCPWFLGLPEQPHLPVGAVPLHCGVVRMGCQPPPTHLRHQVTTPCSLQEPPSQRGGQVRQAQPSPASSSLQVCAEMRGSPHPATQVHTGAAKEGPEGEGTQRQYPDLNL